MVVSLTMVVVMARLDASLRPFRGGNVKRLWGQDIEICGGEVWRLVICGGPDI